MALDPAETGAPLRGIETRSFATLRTITALILREMGTRYGKSPGGYLWAVAEPLGAILVLSIGFSLVLRTPSLGSVFLIFYATGYLPFSLYTTLANSIARALKFSKPLLLYPSVTWIDAVLARFVLNTLTGIAVAYLLILGILLTIETGTVLNMPPVIGAMAMAACLGLGVGMTNCALAGIFPTWDNIWTIVSRPLFLASAIIYIYEDLPPVAQDVLWFNPLVHITGLMRSGFYPMYNPSYISPTYVMLVAMILMVLGIMLLQRHHKDILNA